MSGRRWGQIDGSRIQVGGAGVGGINSDRVRTARERRRDGRTDGRCERPILLRLCTLSMTRRTVTGKEKLLKAEPADKSHGRHSPTHLHSTLCSSFQLFFGIFISPGSTQTHTHACARVYTRRTASPFELSPPGSRGEGGQSGIYVLQFIFVLEAPRRLSSMLA